MALWGAIPPVVVHGRRAVQSAGHPKVFFHPYRSLLHDRRPLAGLSDFVAAGSGESRAQAGRGGIGFWETPLESRLLGMVEDLLSEVDDGGLILECSFEDIKSGQVTL